MVKEKFKCGVCKKEITSKSNLIITTFRRIVLYHKKCSKDTIYRWFETTYTLQELKKAKNGYLLWEVLYLLFFAWMLSFSIYRGDLSNGNVIVTIIFSLFLILLFYTFFYDIATIKKLENWK